jgi:hypothetical protein
MTKFDEAVARAEQLIRKHRKLRGSHSDCFLALDLFYVIRDLACWADRNGINWAALEREALGSHDSLVKDLSFEELGFSLASIEGDSHV